PARAFPSFPTRRSSDLKLRSFGLSNFRGWRIAEVMRLCRELGVPQPVVCQPYYNMLNRGPEVEILPACGHYGLGVVPYSPIARRSEEHTSELQSRENLV